MLRSCALLAVLVALALAPGATAKGPTSLEVCGLASCATVKDRVNPDVVYGVLNVLNVPWERFVSAPPLAPYYELRFDAEWLDDMYSFVPSAGIVKTDSSGVVKADSSWIRVEPALLARLERVIADLEPFPRPKLTRVLVGGRPTADPSVYEALFDPLAPAELPVGAKRIEIVLQASRPSPWTVDQLIGYYAGTGVISRDGGWFALPVALANTLEADSGLASAGSRPPAPETPEPVAVLGADPGGAPAASQSPAPRPPAGNGFPWAAVAVAVAGLLVLLSVALVTLRRTPGRPSTRPS